MRKLEFSKIEIKYDNLEDLSDQGVSLEDQNTLHKIFNELHQSIPSIDISENKLLDLTGKYPHIASVENFLLNLYKLSQNTAKYESLVKAHFEKFPDYLFAKVAYATMIMDYDKNWYNKIFGNALSLLEIYPERKVFHVSEVFVFYSIYFEKIIQEKAYNEAEKILLMLEDLDYKPEVIDSLKLRLSSQKYINTIINTEKKLKEKSAKILETNISKDLTKKTNIFKKLREVTKIGKQKNTI